MPGRRLPVAVRFWNKVDMRTRDECWEWLGAKSAGYGKFSMGGRTGYPEYAHRVAWQLARMPQIPAGMQLDHLCRNRGCVNPWHLEVVTPAENTRRGRSGPRTLCPQGHSYAEMEMFYTRKSGPRSGDRVRYCGECARINQKRRRKAAAS